MSLSAFLDLGCEALAPNVNPPPAITGCTHRLRPSVRDSNSPDSDILNYGVDLYPDLYTYRRHLATLRFKTFALPNSTRSDSVVHKYIAPVLRLFQETVNDADVSYIHETADGNDTTRIYCPDSAGQRSLLCIVKFVDPESICWDGLASPVVIQCIHCIESLTEWESLMAKEQARFLLLVDEHRAGLIPQIRVSTFPQLLQCEQYSLEAGPTSLRNMINLVLHQTPGLQRGGYPWRKVMHGALNQDRGPGKPIAFPSNPQGFADFDRYTLERSRPDIDAFLSWKEEASRHMKERSVVSGDCLRVEVNAFSAEELPWRCPFPHSPIPDETRLYVMRNPRPRLTAVDEILACGKTLDFEVVEVIHHKPDIFSQVFFGVLRALDGRVSPPVCLKLFLDIWFPIKRELLMEYFELEDPSEHLHPVNFPDDMVRREEAAYDRLCEYQGTLIPHCYGFHRFSVEGSFAVYGGLLEIISPPQISHFNFAEASVEKQLGLAKHLRHCLRALLYAGVDQGDYHSGQILVPNGAQYNPERDSLVLIDFAFAIQRLGDEQSPGVVARLLERGELACKYILIGLGITRETLGDLFGLQSLHLNEC